MNSQTLSHVRQRSRTDDVASTTRLRLTLPFVLLLIASWHILADLFMECWRNPDYSHGVLVPLFSGFFIWQRREELKSSSSEGSWAGLFLLLCGVSLLVLGDTGAGQFVMRSALVVTLMGLVAFHFGGRTLHLVIFPLAFLWFMIPLPGVVFYGVTLNLQELSSRSAAFVLDGMGIPVLRDGNVLHLSDVSLGVTEACSGIRSLISLLALSTGWAYVSYPRLLPRFVLVLMAIPIAIVANAVRIVLTGIIGQNIGIEYAEGFFHSFSGWVIFLVALICLSGIHKLMQLTHVLSGRNAA